MAAEAVIMRVDGSLFMVDSITKFYNTIRVAGWFHRPKDRLNVVSVVGDDLMASVSEVGLVHSGVSSLGPDKGFFVQILRRNEDDALRGRLRLETAGGWHGEVPLAALADERTTGTATGEIMQHFVAAVEAIPGARLLDIGGRARSGVDRRELFGAGQTTVVDILPGSNVDVVGDAHELAKLFPPGSFDAALSVAVFEHLLMPWTVVTQMNEVLKPGGIALVFTHQTLGMHGPSLGFLAFFGHCLGWALQYSYRL